MFRHPTLDWRRPTEIADQLQISKQSVHELLGHLEQRYLTREPDPTTAEHASCA
jgi:DNA-binding IclR family transcriptional regulator